MIQINSPAHKQSMMNGAIILDHASVTVVGFDVREGNRGSPNIRCDIAFGVANQGGYFEAYDHRSLSVPFYAESNNFPVFTRTNTHKPTNSSALDKGSDWINTVLIWIEKAIVASPWGQEKFGPGAVVVEHKRRVFDPPGQSG